VLDSGQIQRVVESEPMRRMVESERISNELLITRCVLLPPNAASIFQPMDTSIINSFKVQNHKSWSFKLAMSITALGKA
jgi:hypothetical protein